MKTYKLIKCLLVLVISLVSAAATAKQLAVIDDPDGYTNVRSGPTTKDKILFQIKEKEYFYYVKSKHKSWLLATNMDGQAGYIHASRIKDVHHFFMFGNKYISNDIELKHRTKTIGNTSVTLTQIHTVAENPEKFYPCSVYIRIETPDRETELIKYEGIEGLGGHAGAGFLKDVVPGHICIIKNGDYNGRTILIDSTGLVRDLAGGSVTQVVQERYIVSFAECDFGYCGYAVYDFKNRKIVHQQNYDIGGVRGSGSDIYIEKPDASDNGPFFALKIEFGLLEKIEITDVPGYYDDWIREELKSDCYCH